MRTMYLENREKINFKKSSIMPLSNTKTIFWYFFLGYLLIFLYNYYNNCTFFIWLFLLDVIQNFFILLMYFIN